MFVDFNLPHCATVMPRLHLFLTQVCMHLGMYLVSGLGGSADSVGHGNPLRYTHVHMKSVLTLADTKVVNPHAN